MASRVSYLATGVSTAAGASSIAAGPPNMSELLLSSERLNRVNGILFVSE